MLCPPGREPWARDRARKGETLISWIRKRTGQVALLVTLGATASAQVTEVFDQENPLITSSLTSIAVDPEGRLHVAGDSVVIRREHNGTWMQVLGPEGDGVTPLASAGSIAIDAAGNVYVASSPHSVFKVDPNGGVALVLDSTAGGAGLLDGPTALTTDSAGNLYVAGATSDNVFRLTPEGAVSQLIDADGDGAGNILDQPRDVAVDEVSGAVYVTGYSSGNVFRIGAAGAISEIIDDTYPHPYNPGSLIVGLTSVAVRPNGNVYVSGWETHNVVVITPSGDVGEAMDYEGDWLGHPMYAPADLIVDAQGELYVAAMGSNSVFSVTGFTIVADQYGGGEYENGTNLSYMNGPGGLAVSPEGDLYVVAWYSFNVLRISGPACNPLPRVDFLQGGGQNPPSFTVDVAVVGRDLEFTVDLTTTGHAMACVVGLDSWISGGLLLGGGQNLLIQDGGSGPLFKTGFHPGPIARMSVPVPNNQALVGFLFAAQAIHAFGGQPFALSDGRRGWLGGNCP